MSKYVKTFSLNLVCLLFATFISLSQTLDSTLIFQVSRPVINEFNGQISIELVAKLKGEPVDLQVSQLRFFDEKAGHLYPLEIDLIEDIRPKKQEQLSILFLIDLSGSMKGNKFAGAKAAVNKTITHSKLPAGTQLFLATFHDEISESIPFTAESMAGLLDSLQTTGRDTDLYTAIITKSREMSQFPGKKAIILLSDGEHDVRRNPKYLQGAVKPQLPQVFDALSEVDHNTLVFPVGLGQGADENFLSQLPDSTQNALDVYSFSETPEQLDSIFFRLISGLSGNYRIILENNQLPYLGRPRVLQADWIDDNEVLAQDRRPYRAGKINYPIPAKSGSSFWLKLFAVGLALVFLLFSALSLLIPLFKRREFMKKFVQPYRQQGNSVAFDTVSNEAIPDGTLVVSKCQQLIPLRVWEGVGDKCPHFPECIHSLGCDGAGAEEISAGFFTQKGELKKLNWLWFGAVGGLIAWICYALHRGRFLTFEEFNSLVSFILAKLGVAQLDAAGVCVNCSEIANDTFVGISMGLGFALGLSLPDQLARIQGFAVVRVLLKTLAGAFAGGVAFFFGAAVHPGVISSGFLAGLITWLIFGLLLALILSFQSSIILSRAILAAGLACLVSFIVYNLGFVQGWVNPEPIRLVSLLSLGAITGYIIVSVVTTLEDFEMEFISPDQYRGHMVPISKWLRQGMPVTVGIAPKNQLFVKWHDEAVLDKHATFKLDQNKVWIEPVGEVVLNGRVIKADGRTALTDQDIIQLGRHSRTQLRYKEKRKKGEGPDIHMTEHSYQKGKHY